MNNFFADNLATTLLVMFGTALIVGAFLVLYGWRARRRRRLLAVLAMFLLSSSYRVQPR